MMVEELKPCPFCGNEAHIEDGRNDRPWLVECPNRDCHAQPFMDHADTRSQAVKAWNTRNRSTTDLQAKLDKAVEALQEIDNIAGAWPLSEGYEDSLDLLEMCGKVSVKTLALITAKSERDE